MRVLVLNPPVPAGRYTNRDLMGGMGIDDGFGLTAGTRFVAALKNEGTHMPVVWLAYAAAVLRARGHEVTVLDQSRLAPDDPVALQQASDAQPEWVVAATSFGFLGSELRFLAAVRERTGARRLLLGYTATHFAEGILRAGLAEAIANGDPEPAAAAISPDGAWHGVPGLRVLGPDGSMVDGGPAFVEDLDAVPMPDWQGFPLGEYAYYPLLRARPFLLVQSSRGCPYGCHFCPYPIAQGLPFRARSPRNVVDEMQHLVERWGVRSILFRDPTFTLDLDRARAICEGVIERGLDVAFGIETRLDRMDDALIDVLARAGCKSAEFGVDPIEDPTRRASKRRGIDPSLAASRIARMEANGIATAGLFVIGVPGMSEDEMHRTLDWIDSLDMSYVNYEVATPFPGTPLYEQAVREGWTRPLTFDDLLHGDPKLDFNGVIDGAKMKDLQERALSRFYLRPARLLHELRAGHLLEGLRLLARTGMRMSGARVGGGV